MIDKEKFLDKNIYAAASEYGLDCDLIEELEKRLRQYHMVYGPVTVYHLLNTPRFELGSDRQICLFVKKISRLL